MPAICIYVSALRRKSHGPTVRDGRRLNRLLRWIKKNVESLGMKFIKLKDPRLAVVADSAFSAKEYEGLAMRGHLIMLYEPTPRVPVPGVDWKCVVLGFVSKKQTRIMRSTFCRRVAGHFERYVSCNTRELGIHGRIGLSRSDSDSAC